MVPFSYHYSGRNRNDNALDLLPAVEVNLRIIVVLLILIIPWTLNAYTSSENAKSIIESLKNEPEKWRHDGYRLYYFKTEDPDKIEKWHWDTDCDLHIWIANGWRGIESKHPQKVDFEEEQQKIIWEIYKKWASKFVAEQVFDKNYLKI